MALAAALHPRRSGAQPRPVVVASFSILGDLVAQLAGPLVTLRVLAGPEAEPHDFQPRPSDAAALRDAVLVVRNGLGFEPWLDRLLAAARPRGPVLIASEGIVPLPTQPREPQGRTPVGRFGFTHGPGEPDPHAWLDVRLAQSYLRTIGAGLRAAMPGGAVEIDAAATALQARLEALDAEIRAGIDGIPPARRILVTRHDAFRYFGAAYGLRVLAAQTQPGAAAQAWLLGEIRTHRATALFQDSAENPAAMAQLARDAGVPLSGRLYADTLSAPDGPAPTYEAMMRHNLGLLLPALRR
jgi:zinc/manganese transport system substrate-binding protein